MNPVMQYKVKRPNGIKESQIRAKKHDHPDKIFCDFCGVEITLGYEGAIVMDLEQGKIQRMYVFCERDAEGIPHFYPLSEVREFGQTLLEQFRNHKIYGREFEWSDNALKYFEKLLENCRKELVAINLPPPS